MDVSKLIARAKRVVTEPQAEWPVIAAEPATVGSIYRDYVLVLAAVAPLAGFIGTALFGIHTPLGTIRLGMFTLVRQLAVGYVAALVGVYVLGWLIDTFAPKYGGQKDSVQALKTAAYSATPVWLVGALQIIPGSGYVLWILDIVAVVFAFRLLRQGVVHTMKTPAEKSGGHAGFVVALAVGLGIAVGLVLGTVNGIRQMALKTSPTTSLSDEDADVHVDPSSPLGKLQGWSKNLEQAGKKMEEAEKTGDPNAQQKAMGEMMGALMGGGEVESLEPERLKVFLPESLSGLARSRFSAERNAGMGMQISEAQATYSEEGGRSLDLHITDTGSAKGIMGFAGWAMFQQEKQTDHGYEKSVKRDGRLTHEEWDNQSERGEYSIVVADRFVVNVKGHASGMDQLRSAAESVDLKGLEALKNEGVKKGG